MSRRNEFDVDIVSSIDLSHIEQRLEGAALRVFEDSGREMLEAIKAQWTGWKYVGRDPATVGNSRRAWKHQIQATEGVRTIEFTNKARSWDTNESYAGDVRRRRGATPEWELVRDNLVENYIPVMISKVNEALIHMLLAGRPVRLRENRQSSYRTLTIDA